MTTERRKKEEERKKKRKKKKEKESGETKSLLHDRKGRAALAVSAAA
jgi:hypothetical protein